MKEILNKILQGGFSSIFSRDTSSSVLGIDIGSSAIKVVQLRKEGGKAILETYGALALGPYANLSIGQVTNLQTDAMTQAVNDVLKESNTTVKLGALSIPSSASLIFVISLPVSVPESDMASVVATEARRYIPVPISEVTLDWWVIPDRAESLEDANTPVAENKKEVLVVAIHNDTLSRYRDILGKTGIESNFLEMEAFSLVRASISHELSPTLIIDLGASKTRLSVIEYGIVKNFHVINRGGQDISNSIAQSLNISFKDAEEAKRDTGLDVSKNSSVANIVKFSVDYILNEAKSVVFAYEKKYNKTISKVILSGGGAMIKGLLERSTDAFQAEVVHSDPFSKTEAPAFLVPILKETGPEFSVAIGLALRQLS